MLSPVEDDTPAAGTALDVSIDPSSCNTSKCNQDMLTNETSGNNVLLRCLCAISPELIRKVLAEGVGTFILVFCIYGIHASMSLMGIKTGLLEYAVTAAFTIIIVVITIGPISDAHVNPAITIASAIVGLFPWSKVPLYIAAQMGGSVLGTFVGWLVYGINIELMMTKPAHGCFAAFCVEFIASFIMLFLIASLTNDTQPNAQLSALVAGIGVGLGVLVSGPVSGGSMNPARSLGPAIISWDFEFLWIYIVAPILGSIFGGLLFRIIRLQGWSCQ